MAVDWLVHSCRDAKEQLLSSNDIASHKVTVLGRGSRLIGGTVSIDLLREDVEKVIVDGFFPICTLNDRPEMAWLADSRN